MNTEILFKAKRFDGEGCVEGDLIQNDKHTSIRLKTWNEKHGWLTYEVISETVCQFINHKDDKKVGIFNGDKVQINYGRHELERMGLTRTGVVVYENCCYVVKIDDSQVRVPFSIISKIEVIGNIHD